jgi:hypothetical protein
MKLRRFEIMRRAVLSRAVLPTVAVLLLSPVAFAQTKSKVLGKWKEVELLINGKPDRPSLAKGEEFVKSEMQLDITASGNTVTLRMNTVMPMPGQPTETISSETLLLNLTEATNQKLIPWGPDYSTTAKLEETSLVVTYSDKETGQVVRVQRWILSQDGKTLEASSNTPGTKECLSTREWDPSKPLPNLRELAASGDCKPSSGLVRIFKKR